MAEMSLKYSPNAGLEFLVPTFFVENINDLLSSWMIFKIAFLVRIDVSSSRKPVVSHRFRFNCSDRFFTGVVFLATEGGCLKLIP